MKKVYSTALSKNLSPTVKYKYTGDMIKDNIAFLHNIENECPDYYKNVDVFYSEPAWAHGYNLFMNKSKFKSSSFGNYVENICNFIKNFDKPAIIICGKKDSALYKKLVPFKSEDIILKIHNCKCVALFYKIDLKINFTNNEEILTYISKKYNCVGDFCCGYGNTADVFYNHGKNFVVSDVIDECIAYIKTKYENI
jgi:hypothetical protein